MPRPPEALWLPLNAYLMAQAGLGVDRVTLTFATLETAILGRPLPATARHPVRHRAWWGGHGNSLHAWYGWLRVGWRVAAVDRAAETITFARGAAPGSSWAVEAQDRPNPASDR